MTLSAASILSAVDWFRIVIRARPVVLLLVAAVHVGIASSPANLGTTITEELRAHRAAQAQELLKLGVRLSDDHFVCTHADGRMMQPTWITHEWIALISKTGLPRIRFHDLRHAHATHMLAGGIHPKIASERLGHSKVGITLDLYSHVMPGMQENAAAQVDAALQAARKKLR